MTASPVAGPAIAELHIGAEAADIARATGWLGGLAEAGGWPQETRFALELSLEEALANVVMHAFKAAPQVPRVRVACHKGTGGRIIVTVTDNGIPFDPTGLAEPEVPAGLEAAKIGGHGVQLMRHFLESLSYARAGDENCLTLVARPAPVPDNR